MPRSSGPAPRPERYWTDYLRIALPIIGLILMLSLFIFWVGSIINSNGDDSTPTTVPVALVETPDPSTAAGGPPTATIPAAGSAAASSAPQAGTNPTAASSDGSAPEPTTSPGGEPTQPAGADAATETPAGERPTDTPASGNETFAPDDKVVVNDDGVRIRDAAGTEAAEVVTVNTGDALTIVSGPETANEFDWYEVTTENGTKGWIASQFLDPAGG